MMVYLITPIYNEEKNIRSLVESIRDVLADYNYRIIAVNDGSQDSSLEILEEINNGDIEIKTHKINMNIGAAFSTGINHVLKNCYEDDVILIIESDQTSDPQLFSQMVDKIVLDKKDVCIASRYLDGGKYVNFPFMRLVYSKIVNNMLKILFPMKNVTDYTIFFRSYRAKLLMGLVDIFGPYSFIQSKGFAANAEILIKSGQITDRIAEIPFIYNYGSKQGKSKLSVLKTIFEYFHFIFDIKSVVKKMKNHL
jgi:dolichol-phosphate mannosyltransferase